MATVSRDMRILVIERDREVALKILAYFEARGHQLDTIGDGIAGLHFAASNGYDAVVLDWMLPRMEGPEVLRRLRLNHGVSVPVVMLAAKAAADRRAHVGPEYVGGHTGWKTTASVPSLQEAP